ncbi:MAG: hypothetical protein AAFX06_13385 [Planctomycetota bacterium]
MDTIAEAVRRVCDATSSDQDVVLAAVTNDEQAVFANQSKDFPTAVRHAQIASALWERLSQSETASATQRMSAKLSRFGTATCLGSSQWKSGDFDAAKQTFAEARGALTEMEPEVCSRPKPSGIAKFIPFVRPRPDQDTIREWLQTLTAIHLNEGVMFHASEDYKASLACYENASHVLFDRHVKRIGPEDDLESTGKVINIWENTMACGLDADDPPRAAHAAANAIKLVSFWPSHGREIPGEVTQAFATFLGRVAGLSKDDRERLDAALPDGLAEWIDSWIED